jgi:hypothetical protein
MSTPSPVGSFEKILAPCSNARAVNVRSGSAEGAPLVALWERLGGAEPPA